MGNIQTFNRVVTVEVDVQNDFCPGGSLAINDGDKVVAPLNQAADWTRSSEKGLVSFTSDWHPLETNHFGNPPDFVNTWPVHCVANTYGAQFHPDLIVKESDVVLHKATLPDEDGYSGFDGASHDGLTLEAMIRPINHERVAVVIGGLATDYCVRATALDAAKFASNFRDNPARYVGVFLLTDAIRAVAKESGEKALAEMQAAGVSFITTDDLVNDQVIKVREA